MEQHDIICLSTQTQCALQMRISVKNNFRIDNFKHLGNQYVYLFIQHIPCV